MALGTDRPEFSLRPISLIVAVSIVVMTGLQAAPTSVQHALRYDRGAVAGGEIWRVITGHFVHLGWSHLALNMAGLILGTWLFGTDRSPAQWVMATLVSALVCGVGLYILSPGVGWCVGLSGVLHGLMVVGFGGWVLAGDRWAIALLGVVIGKMLWEQAGGSMPWESTLAGGNVITDAHLWGAIGGALFLAADTGWRGWRARV